MIPLIWLAHPMGVAALVAVGPYIVLAEYTSPRRRLYLLVAPVLILAAISLFIRFHLPADDVTWDREPRSVHDGFDQLLLFGPQYLVPARLLRAFVCACLLLDLVRRRHAPRGWARYRLAAEVYFLILMGVILLPTDIDSRILHQTGFVPIGLIKERLTTVLAILVCCLLGAMKPQKWHLLGFSAIATVFFFYLYNDTGAISRMEDQMDSLVGNLAPGQRLVSAIEAFPSSLVGTSHIIDRACIAHCYSYDNYEPQVSQFRVRANFGNPYVVTDRPTTWDTQGESFVVQPRDLPLLEVDRCGLGGATLCVRELAAGDKLTVGLKVNRTWLARFGGTTLLFDLLLASILAAAVSVGQRLILSDKQVAAE